MTPDTRKAPQTPEIGPLGDFPGPVEATPATTPAPRTWRVLVGLVPAFTLAGLGMVLLVVSGVLRVLDVAVDAVARVITFLAYYAIGSVPPSGKWPNEGAKGRSK